MNSYDLSRSYWDFAFENPDKVKPIHAAMFFFAIEHCNRLGWKSKFGFPTSMVKEAIGVKSFNTYKKIFNDLVDWGFFELIQESKNQYSSNIIALSINDKALDKSLDKALIKHGTKQTSKQSESTVQSTGSINKQDNKEQDNQKTKNKSTILLSEVSPADIPMDQVEFYEIAISFHKLIGKNISQAGAPTMAHEKAKYKTWVDPIRLMIQQDGYNKGQFRVLFENLKTNGFWQKNIQCTASLRKHANRLLMDKNGKQKTYDPAYLQSIIDDIAGVSPS